ncbi:MAG: LacI family DNA-binding transcriptional regulator, partial [Protaetiibacter sp.]
MPTIRAIAEAAGVSIAAVSAVINGSDHTRVSAKTRARIETVITETGYIPNAAARALRRQETRRLALVLHRLDNPTLHEAVLGFTVSAASLGKTILINGAEWSPASTNLLSQLLVDGSVDGVVVHTLRAITDELREALKQHPRPVIAMEETGEPGGPWVSIDNYG